MLKNFIILLLSATCVVSQKATCTYSFIASTPYTCNLIISNPNGFNNFTNINGSHVDGKTDDDVRRVYQIDESTSTNVPSIICEKFQNTNEIRLNSIGIETIDEKSFRNCKNLNELRLNSNKISEIHEDAFVENIDLITLSLYANALKSLPSGVFRKQMNLETLLLNDNQLEMLPNTIFSTLSSLKYLELSNNSLIIFHSDLFDMLPNFKSVILKNNVLESFDERIIDNTRNSEIITANNSCLSEEINIRDDTEERSLIRAALSQCFANYHERADATIEDITTTNIFEHSTTLTVFELFTANTDETITTTTSTATTTIGNTNEIITTTVDIPTTSTSSTDSLPLFCVYQSSSTGYFCQLYISNLNGFDNYTHIDGGHTRTDDEVQLVTIYGNSTSTNVPSIICEQFKNIEKIELKNIGIETIGVNSFRNCKNLKQLSLSGNAIKEIHENAFVENVNLIFIDFDSNDLRNLPSGVFRNQKNLETFYLQKNQLEELPAGIFSSLTSMESLFLDENKLTVLHSNSFGSLPKLSSLSFQDNNVNAIDEKIIDNIGVRILDAGSNTCVDEDDSIIDNSVNKTLIKVALKRCIDNYKNQFIVETTTGVNEIQICDKENLIQRILQLEVENEKLKHENEKLRNKSDETSVEGYQNCKFFWYDLIFFCIIWCCFIAFGMYLKLHPKILIFLKKLPLNRRDITREEVYELFPLCTLTRPRNESNC